MSEKIFESVTIPPKKGIKIECNCGNIWVYSGKNPNYCSCSKCRTTITINKKKKKDSLYAKKSLERKLLHTMKEETASECRPNHV
jgi:hypothetical protein